MTNHTPTPWYHRTDFNQVGSIENGDGKIIAQVQSYESGDHARRDVDAAHIVHCVNLHDELVEACKKLLSCAYWLDDWDSYDPSATYARSVLAKAEGNSNV